VKILLEDKWCDGYPDYYRPNNYVRVKILALLNIKKIEGLYFVRSRDLRIVWNYIKEIGIREVAKKVVSRSNEKHRNNKYVSIGLGTVVQSDHDKSFKDGESVVFLIPSGPACCERVVLPRTLVARTDIDVAHLYEKDTLLYKPRIDENINIDVFQGVEGWDQYSGEDLKSDGKNISRETNKILKETGWSDARRLKVSSNGEISETIGAARQIKSPMLKKGVLFGYGNYAKTIIIPNIKNYIDVRCIHEIDPLQMDLDGHNNVVWDTSPDWRGADHFDVAFIAGYHHTHAPLALNALKSNIHAVSEKPIVVDQFQLDNLLAAVKTSKAEYFACFHKRYLKFNDYVRKDLDITEGDPVSYHCIVYEVPLPRLHWYRWPNSKSRLISNGCHWIDHFLFLNGYCEPERVQLFVSKKGVINCSIALKNGALFTMVLTDEGSERLGVQDYIELRSGAASITMKNGGEYLCENRSRILRKSRMNKMHSYKNMYTEICKNICYGRSGDSPDSIKISGEVTLELEDLLQNANKQTNRQ
jgi:predicted dehydrogenase